MQIYFIYYFCCGYFSGLLVLRLKNLAVDTFRDQKTFFIRHFLIVVT